MIQLKNHLLDLKSFYQGIVLLVALCTLSLLPSSAEDANTPRVQKLLEESTASFKQNNYMLGVSQVRDACILMKSDPAAGDGSCTYMDLAGGCIESVEKSIQGLPVGTDLRGTAELSRRVTALQPLLQTCREWEPANPRWRYESGRLYRLQSSASGDRFPYYLQQAAAEFQKAVSMRETGPYRERAISALRECDQVIKLRQEEFAQWQRDHPQPKSHGHTGLTYVFCNLCGAKHKLGEPCIWCHNYMVKPGLTEVDI